MNRKNGGEKTAPKLTKKILAEAQEMPKTGVFLHHFSLFWAHTPSSNIFLQKHADYKHTRRCRLFRSPPPTHRDTHIHKRERERRGPEVYSSNNDNSTPLSIRLVSRFRTLARFRRKEWMVQTFCGLPSFPPPTLPASSLFTRERTKAKIINKKTGEKHESKCVE